MQIFFWPLYASRLVNLSLWIYLRQAWIKSYVAVIPFAIACYVVEQQWTAHSLLLFAVQMVALLPFLIGGVALCFWREVVDWLRSYPFTTLRVFLSTTAR
jgi:hypothetical protein